MRIKGVSWIEINFEKLIAGLLAIAMLGVLTWQFMTPPVTVKVGVRDVPISEVGKQLTTDAKVALGKIRSEEAPTVEGGDAIVDSVIKSRKALREPVAPEPTLAAALGTAERFLAASLDLQQRKGIGSDIQFPAMTIDAPTRPIASAFLACVHPAEAANSEAKAILPPNLPFDTASVTAEFTFSGKTFRQLLSTDPDESGPIVPVPPELWDGQKIQILDVQIERQQISSTGTWSESQPVDGIPGRYSLKDRLAKPIRTSAELSDLAHEAAANAEQIRRPEYWSLFQGEPWIAPTDRPAAEDPSKAKEIAQIRAAHKAASERKLKAEQDLAKLPQPKDQPQRPPVPAPGAGGGGGGGGGGGIGPGGGRGAAPAGGGGAGGGDQNLTNTQIIQKRKNLERIIEQETRKIEDAIRSLKALGDDVSDLEPDIKPADGRQRPVVQAPPLLDDPNVRIWAHDVRVSRGATYRYRARVILSNPFYLQTSAVPSTQQDLAADPTIASAWSEWSEPTKVDDENYYFVAGAQLPDSFRRIAGARVDVFTFRWGYWRQGLVQLDPGDRIETSIKAPDYSIIAQRMLDDALSGKQPDQPGRGGGQRGGPGQVAPAGGKPQQTDAGSGGSPTDKIPEALIPVKIDATLLSVALYSADPHGNMLVSYFRDSLGKIAERLREIDQQSGLLAKLKMSVSQSQLPKEIKADGPPIPRPAAPEHPNPFGPGGGKDAGGGRGD